MGENIESERLSKSSDKVVDALPTSLLSANDFAFLGSTLSKSDQKLKLSPLLAEYPRLPQSDTSSYVQYTQKDMAKVSISILLEWGKALAEAAELVKKEIDSHEALKAELIEKYAWLNSLGALVSTLIHMDSVKGQGITHATDVGKEYNPLTTLVPQFLLLAIADSAHLQGGALVGGASAIDGLHAESKVFQGAWRAITNDNNDHSTLIAGWVSSLWGVGLIYQSSIDSMKNDGVEKQKRDKSSNINFAKTYAETILGVVCSGQFSTFVEAALASASDQATDEGGENNSLILKVKLVLLSIALALLLKLEEGTTSELSFSGLLKGEVDLTKNDPYSTASLKRALIDEIQLILAALEPDERDFILYSLLGYMSTNPAIEEMLDQQKVFKNVLNNNPLENELITQRPLSA
ncbi:MAG: hypothetical protein H0T62_07605 [Parachlamydiaceae bacterium]|nr:hypothetical protein [Parachlamydiaceae bacterium]